MNSSREMSDMLRASVWKMLCMKGTYMSVSWTRNDIDTVVTSMLFCVMPHPRPRFCIADTRSRKTKQVKVWWLLLTDSGGGCTNGTTNHSLFSS